MKKNKTAALLAATLLIYGGAFSVQADYGADAGENLDETGKTYSDGVYADAGGTFIIHDGVVNGSNGKMTAQGGTLTLNNSTSSIGAWASEVNGSAGTINLNGSQTTGSDIVAQGYGAAVHVNGGAVNVDGIMVRQDTLIDSNFAEKTNDAQSGSTVTISNGASVITGNILVEDSSKLALDGGTLTVNGTTNVLNGSTVTTANGTTFDGQEVDVDNSTFTAGGNVNTTHFAVRNNGVVSLNGGTLSGQNDTSALYAKTGATVNAKNVTFTGGEVAVDSGATLNLTGGTVDAPVDAFTTEGGTITTDGTTINSGVWSHSVEGYTGTVTLNNSTINGGAIGAQDASTITMNGGKANVSRISAEAGSKVYLVGGANAETDNLTAIGQDSEININGNASVTTNNIDAETGTVGVGSTGKLTVNGTANFKDSAQFALSDGATVDVNGKVNLYDASGITVNGSTMTFQSGSELHMNGNDISKAVAGVQAINKGRIIFADGSASYTMANADNTVATVATADADSTIEVEENALLYVNGVKADGTTVYDISNATVQQGTQTGWAGKVYGSSLLQVMDKETGTFENRNIGEAFPGTMGAAAFTAALEDNGSPAANFVNTVVTPVTTNTEEQEVARITNTLNSAAGMTGLAGVAQGTYRFTTAFTDLVANHEAGGLWAAYLHDKSSVDGLSVGNLRADYDLTFDGVVVGSDFYNNGRTSIGAAFAYADGDISTNSGVSTSNDVDYYGGMIYGAVKGGAGMTYRAEIGYNRSSNDLTQWNTGTRITGSVDADAFHVGVSAEKEIRTGAGVWTPFLGLQYMDLSLDDYSDSLGFRHEGDSAGLWNMPLGVSYKLETTHGAWTYAPVVTLGYRFVFGDDSIDETLSYNGVGSTFGTDVGEDSFFTRVGFEAKKDNLGFGVHYGYERGSDTEANQWGINCSFFF